MVKSMSVRLAGHVARMRGQAAAAAAAASEEEEEEECM
jgi:hypothetical protein